MMEKDKVLILKDNPDWKYIPLEDLKVYIWNNVKYAREKFGIGYAEHDFEVANVYPLIRFVFSDEIEKMYSTKELYAYHGTKEIVEDSVSEKEDKERYDRLMERYKYSNHPVWGLQSAGHDHLEYEGHIASAILYSPTPKYSVMFIGETEKEQIDLSWEERIPCLLAICDTEKIELHYYSSMSHSSKTYEKPSFPIFKRFVEGNLSWYSASKLLEFHRRKSPLEIASEERKKNKK